MRVVIVGGKDEYFYDNQIIKSSEGECVRQIGIYKTNYETIPMVIIMKK